MNLHVDMQVIQMAGSLLEYVSANPIQAFIFLAVWLILVAYALR